jgi:hypothetical protein
MFVDLPGLSGVKEVQGHGVLEYGRRVVEEEMNRPQPRRAKGSPAGAALR